MSDVAPTLRRVPTQIWVAYGLSVACFILLGLTTSDGFSLDRLVRVLANSAPLGVAAIAQTLVIVNRGLDLSVGPNMNLAAIVTALMLGGSHGSIALTVVTVVALGAGIGLVNGVMLAFTRIPPLLGTLAMATVLQGVYQLFTHGQPRGRVPGALAGFANDRILGTSVTWSLILWVALLVIVGLLLSRTVAGQRFYAVGANPRASWLSGVPIKSHTLFAYTASGALSAVAGVMLLAYAGSPSLTAADSYALNSVVAAVIGGASLAGGSGGMVGTFAGVAVLGLLATVLTSFNIPTPVQQIVNGAVLILMLFVNTRLAGRRRG